jgi:hypothetical protein
MKLSRRQFLTLAAGAIGTHTAIAWGLDRFPRAQAQFNGSTAAADTVGQLNDAAMTTLMALVAAYVDPHGSTGHYRAYFGWRAENLPGYLSVYEDFTAALDAAAQALEGADFASASADAQQAILRDALELPEPVSDLFSPTYTDPDPTTPLTLRGAALAAFPQHGPGRGRPCVCAHQCLDYAGLQGLALTAARPG